MNILVINLSLRPMSKTKYFPVGLGYIATAIKNAGFDFDLLDIDVNRPTEEDIINKISSKKYDIVCMGCIVTGYKIVKSLCENIKNIHPDCTIIVGNSVATSVPNILLSKTMADIAVLGEGDVTIIDLLDCLINKKDISGVDGICFKKDGNIIKTAPRKIIKDISSIPNVNYDLFDIEKYIAVSIFNIGETQVAVQSPRAMPINGARGCINRCDFCYHVFRGNAYRYRTAKSIVDEIKFVIDRYGINYIMFWDELTFFGKEQVKRFTKEVFEQKLNFYWVGNCRADLFYDDKDSDIIKAMKDSGCIAMQYSLESSDPNILKTMNKHISPEQFEKQTKMYKKEGITVSTSLVMGYPQETEETIKNTFDFCIKTEMYPSVGFLLPQPGSPIYERAKTEGFIKDEEEYLMSMGDRQDLRLNMTKMTDEQLENAVLEGLKRCNEVLKVGLDESSLIKTGTYKIKKD